MPRITWVAYVDQLLVGMLMAAQNEERGEVVGLNQDELNSVIYSRWSLSIFVTSLSGGGKRGWNAPCTM